jgi:hypothetical protein
VTTGVSGFDEQAHLVVLFDGHAFFARRAERGEPRVLEFAFFGLREKFDVLGIAARPAAFNVMNPESVELLGDAELVRDREIDAFALRTVAQGRVVDFDLGFHKCRKNGRTLSLNLAAVANVAEKDDYLVDMLVDLGFVNAEAGRQGARGSPGLRRGRGGFVAGQQGHPPGGRDAGQGRAVRRGGRQLGRMKIPDEVISIIPRHIAKKYRVIPVFKTTARSPSPSPTRPT